MNLFTPKSDKSLRVATLNKGKAPEPKGIFSREKLTEIIRDYIYAYLETTITAGQPVPTLMFVMHQIGIDEPSPIVVPFSIGDYDSENLEGFVALLVEQYPPEEYAFHMALYARFDADFRAKGEFTVLFGAKDSWGSSVHTAYLYKRYPGYDEMSHKKMNVKYFDKWINRPLFRDDYLNTAVAQYHTFVNMRAVKTYAS